MKHHFNLKKGWSHSHFGTHCHSSPISTYTTTVHPHTHMHYIAQTHATLHSAPITCVRTYVRTYQPLLLIAMILLGQVHSHHARKLIHGHPKGQHILADKLTRNCAREHHSRPRAFAKADRFPTKLSDSADTYCQYHLIITLIGNVDREGRACHTLYIAGLLYGASH